MHAARRLTECTTSDRISVTVDGTPETCGALPLPAPASDECRCFSFSAGTYPWAGFYWW
jgi:hypothetical protein